MTEKQINSTAIKKKEAHFFNSIIKSFHHSHKVIGNTSIQVCQFVTKVQARAEVIDFVVISTASSCLSKVLPGLNSDLYTVTPSKLSVCGVIKKKYGFIKAKRAAAMIPGNAEHSWSKSLGG